MTEPRLNRASKKMDGILHTEKMNQVLMISRNKGSLPVAEIIQFGIRQGSVLEIGPGPGYLGLEWLKRTKETKLTGLESNQDFGKIAERNAEGYGFLGERAKYFTNLTRTIPFEDESYDAVVSFASMHDWNEPKVMLNEIYRVLKPGGRYYISDLRWDTGFFTKIYLKLLKSNQIHARLFSATQIAFTLAELKNILAATKLNGSHIQTHAWNFVVCGYKPKIVNLKKPIPYIGLALQTNSKQAAGSLQLLQRRFLQDKNPPTIPNQKSESSYIVVTQANPSKAAPNFYFIGKPVETLAEIPKGLTGFEIPIHKYAVFTVQSMDPGHLKPAIADMKRYIYQEWLPNCNFEKAPELLELVLYDERSQAKSHPEADIYIAI